MTTRYPTILLTANWHCDSKSQGFAVARPETGSERGTGVTIG